MTIVNMKKTPIATRNTGPMNMYSHTVKKNNLKGNLITSGKVINMSVILFESISVKLMTSPLLNDLFLAGDSFSTFEYIRPIIPCLA